MIRRIVEDYECRLVPVDAGTPGAGKAEHERFANGDVEFEVRVRDTTLPDGTRLDVHLAQGVVGSIELKRGRGELKIESRKGAAVPPAVAGDRIVVTLDGMPLLAGVFAKD